MGDEKEHDPLYIVDDEKIITRRDILWMRDAQKTITPEVLEEIRRSHERTVAIKFLGWILGTVALYLGLPKVVQLLKKFLEVIGQ